MTQPRTTPPSNVVITGASAGIGAAAAVELARRGDRVLAVGRNKEKLDDVFARMKEVAPEPKALYEPVTADFASLAAVRSLADELLQTLPTIDVLANNAGLILTTRTETIDGFETTFAVNHLAPFLLTNLLLDRLADSKARVITTSSIAHRGALMNWDDLQLQRYGTQKAYGQSKLANILFTLELRKRTEGRGIAATCFHPGGVATSFGRGTWIAPFFGWIGKAFLRSPEKGAETLVFLATDDEGRSPSGLFYFDCKPRRTTMAAVDEAAAARLWDLSAEMVGLS